VEVIDVPVLPPRTDQVTDWRGLSPPDTVTVNGWTPPFDKLTVEGVTVTPVTAAVVASTLTVVLPLFVVSTVDTALMVKVALAISLLDTERTPPVLITVPALPPFTDQVTVWAGLLFPCTVAVKGWVEPFFTFTSVVLMVTPVTEGGPPVSTPPVPPVPPLPSEQAPIITTAIAAKRNIVPRVTFFSIVNSFTVCRRQCISIKLIS
jgi:hypothetical protein